MLLLIYAKKITHSYYILTYLHSYKSYKGLRLWYVSVSERNTDE